MKFPSSSASDSASLPTRTEGSATRVWLAVLLLLAAGVLAYSNSFSGAFVYDDRFAIVENHTLGQLSLWPKAEPGSARAHEASPVAGRPLVNFSFALNHTIGGLNPWGYHLVNLSIHLGAGLALFGVVRRTLARKWAAIAPRVALLAASLWLVHPLTTEAVTYLSQRAEALMALCYLLTLYFIIRGAERQSAGGHLKAGVGWYALAFVACLSGMASKEVMVSAPIVVIAYDRVFLSGSFREGWRLRGAIYVALLASWLLLAWLVIQAGSRGGTAGFGASPQAWSYCLMQGEAIVRYIALAIWPHPLVFDYGVENTTGWSGLVFYTVLVAAIFLTGVTGLFRGSPTGFLTVAFFAVLAPSSSVVPITTEVMAEHRMYLPLAVLAVMAVWWVHARLGRRSLYLLFAVAAAFGMLTHWRNADYGSERGLWEKTVAYRPSNARARFNLGTLLAAEGRTAEAVRQYRAAVALRPEFASAHSNLSNGLLQQGETREAEEHAVRAVQIDPSLPEARNNLGQVLFQTGRKGEAVAEFREAVRLRPNSSELLRNYGSALTETGHLTEALEPFRQAVHLAPEDWQLRFNLGNTLARLGRWDEAIEAYQAALRLNPELRSARDNLERVRVLRASVGNGR